MCLFCDIIDEKIPSYKIYEDENTYAFLDIACDVLGHTLVIPKKHCENVLDADAETLKNVMITVNKISKHYVENCGFSGVNLVNCSGKDAEQSVFHFHIHILPRKENDGISVFPNLKKEDIDLAQVQKDLQILN